MSPEKKKWFSKGSNSRSLLCLLIIFLFFCGVVLFLAYFGRWGHARLPTVYYQSFRDGKTMSYDNRIDEVSKSWNGDINAPQLPDLQFELTYYTLNLHYVYRVLGLPYELEFTIRSDSDEPFQSKSLVMAAVLRHRYKGKFKFPSDAYYTYSEQAVFVRDLDEHIAIYYDEKLEREFALVSYEQHDCVIMLNTWDHAPPVMPDESWYRPVAEEIGHILGEEMIKK